MPTFQSVLVRRQDGLVKQWQQTSINAAGSYGKQGVRLRFSPVFNLNSLDGTTDRLVVCEKTNMDVNKTEPFTRVLPGILRHRLFFGDLLIVVQRGDGSHDDLTVADMARIFEGEHPKWSVRGIRDVSQQTETFDEELSEEEEEDKSEDEEDSEDDDEMIIDDNDDAEQHSDDDPEDD